MSAATEPVAPVRARFEYRALRINGAIEIGALDARSIDEVRSLLVARGLFPVSVDTPLAESAAQASLRPEELAAGLRLLGSLLGAGLPMDRALTVFLQIAPTGWSGPLLENIRAKAREGERISDALHSTILTLPGFVRGLIAAGDANGGLADGLVRAADELESANAARAALRAALAYPALLAVAGTVAVGILVGVVLPRFAELLSDLGQSLPWSTRVVLAVSAGARAAFVPALLAAVLSAVAWHWWIASTVGARTRAANALLRVPVVGRIRAAAAGARVTATLGALLATRVPLATALEQAGGAAGDAAIAQRLDDARERVLTGETLSRALSLSEAVPPSAIQLIRAGEATGDVSAMLVYAAKLDRERVQTELRALVRLVEPVMILAFGGLVALVAASLLQAVYAVRPVA